MRYRFFDFVLESDIELPELEPADDCPPAIRVVRDDRPESAPTPRWFRTVDSWRDGPWVEVGREADGFVLRFIEGLIVRYQARELRWRALAGRDHAVLLRHMLLDQALPLIAAHQGRTVLHAACVWRGGEAMLFLGPAGAGKSTLAAVLAREPDISVADDAIAVTAASGGIAVSPAYGGLRLWPDTCDAIGYDGGEELTSRSDKRRFPGSMQGRDALLLRAIYVLAPTGAADAVPLIRPLTRREAVMALVRNAYVLDVEDRARAVTHLDAISQVAGCVPVRKLVLPRRFDALADVRRLLKRDLGRGVTA